jgi:hypothetical protein
LKVALLSVHARNGSKNIVRLLCDPAYAEFMLPSRKYPNIYALIDPWFELTHSRIASPSTAGLGYLAGQPSEKSPSVADVFVLEPNRNYLDDNQR